MPPRALIAYCIDVDCCAPWLCTGTGKPEDATSLSRGLFGANVGLDRLLKFFKTHGDIKATFNIPSHTLETFPERCKRIREAGHEIGLHGYLHEPPASLTEQQERDVLSKSIAVYKSFTNGVPPQGFIAPNWAASTRTIRLLEEHGVRYDHSLMAHDCQPHWASDVGEGEVSADFEMEAGSWMRPMRAGKQRDVVEIPGNWDLTDFAAFNFVPQASSTHGYVDPHLIERNWKEMFTWWYREYNSRYDPQGFVFCLTIHPQSSGKPHIMAMHERFVSWLRESWDGVEFVTCAQVAEEFREGRLRGAEILGGL